MNGDPIARRARDPVSDFWSHIEAYIGTQFSALGSHCRIPGVCWRRAKTPTPIRPLSPAGAYRFAPDPNCKMKKPKQKKCERWQAKAIHKL